MSGDPTKCKGQDIVAAYRYEDEDGKLLYTIGRLANTEEKQFTSWQPDPDNPEDYKWGLEGVRKVLYRLPEVRRTAEAGGRVYLVEGEKDADAVHQLGLCATTNPHGAGTWSPEYSEMLRGASNIIIVADNDKPGQEHARAVADSLRDLP
jgi:hypothetical protein